MHSFFQDLKYAVRTLLKRPLFTSVALTSLALGIAVNATVFSWVDRILLRPLPGVINAGEIVALKTVAPNGDLLDSSYLDFKDFQKQATTLSAVIAFKQRPLYLGDVATGERVWSEMVSGNFFDVLGVRPIRGRTFSAEEQNSRPGSPATAVLSETLWRGYFRSDPDILGRKIELNRHPFTVIGIVPSAFQGTVNGLRFDLWVPLTMVSELTGSFYWPDDRNARPLDLMARLKPNTSLKQAQAEVQTIASRLALEYPDTNRYLSAAVMPIADSPAGAQRILGRLLKVLLVIAAAVLLIVCANLGNLLLVRATMRTKEFGIRASLGASPRRIAQQLFTETLVLAVGGTALGLLASAWMVHAVEFFVPPTDLPLANLAHGFHGLDLLFTCALGFLAAIFCGIAPALQLFRHGIQEALREGGRFSSPAARSRILRSGLVVFELSLALFALIGSGLFIRSFQNARNAYPGFEPEGVLLAGIDLSQAHLSKPQRVTFFQRLRDQLTSLPGARSASLSEHVPLGFDNGAWEEIRIEGYIPKAGENMKLWRDIVSPGYFATLKIPLAAGRDFNERDSSASQPVAIVNETFVKRFLPEPPALGRKFLLWDREFTIIGVARDIKYQRLNEGPMPYFYLPLAQAYSSDMGIAVEVRTASRPDTFAEVLRSRIRSADPNVLISVTIPFASFMSASYFAQRVGAHLLTVLGVISLLLAILGLYGVMAYSTTQRTGEIGIRMALGAQPAQVLQLVMREGMGLCLIGIALGLIPSLVLARLAASALYGVGNHDGWIYFAGALILSAAALLATWLPARRAAHIEPTKALHWE
ncbi:MAG: ABC transporter permease [Acidobacteriaceae bacterium]|nr:ABC transporter permease [Acidobacteriaceae bacterium]